MIRLCYCYTCERYFHSLGIARHRAMHRDKREDCKIKYANGDTWTHMHARKNNNDEAS